VTAPERQTDIEEYILSLAISWNYIAKSILTGGDLLFETDLLWGPENKEESWSGSLRNTLSGWNSATRWVERGEHLTWTP
jgi:hypothetical protein